jgi:hypothetical protein
MKAHQERMVAMMEACLEGIGPNQEKLDPKMETNQEKVKAVAEPYKWALHIKAMHLLTALQDWA